MIFTKTADISSAPVIDFCSSINPNAQPIRLPIRSGNHDQTLDCFNNVRRKVLSEGGRLVLGWAIWEWPNIYVEAEHHAIYEPPGADAQWLDITPSDQPHISARVFVEDADATYDFANEGVRRDNKRKALVDDPLVERFFQTARDYSAIMNSIPGVGNVNVPLHIAQRLKQLELENTQLTLQLAMKHSPRNAPCFCGSGKKFKRCHGQ